MQLLRLMVPIGGDWDAGDRIQVFTDFGTGMVDTSKPLLGRPFDLFASQHSARGVGTQPVGVGRIGSLKASRKVAGIGSAVVGVTPVGTAPVEVALVVAVPAASGKWKLAVQRIDRAGRVAEYRGKFAGRGCRERDRGQLDRSTTRTRLPSLVAARCCA